MEGIMSKQQILFVVSFVILISMAGMAQDLTLDQILRKYEEAVGGAEAIGRIQTVKATYTTVQSGNGMDMKSTTYMKRPNLVRNEMTMGRMTFVSGFDGTTGWKLDPETGAAKDDSVRGSSIENTIYEFADTKARGSQIELIGKEDVKGSPAYKLRVTNKPTDPVYMHFIDAKTFLPVKSAFKMSVMGNEVQVESYTGDYRKIEGVMLLTSMETHTESQGTSSNSQAKYEYEINVPLDDSLFKMPSGQDSK
jgi:hypothetical protein